MYCPKCKDRFEEGSRRFCPTDGARLISDSPFTAGRRASGGIFSNLVSKDEVGNDLSEPFSDIPQFVITEPEPPKTDAESDVLGVDFFEFEDVEQEPMLVPAEPGPVPVFEQPVRSFVEPIPTETIPEVKPTARKVKPFEIPAGHVELGERTRLSVSDFDIDDPESFVGRIVKGRYRVTEFLGGEEESFAFLADDRLVADKLVLVRIIPNLDDETSGIVLDEEIVALSHISHPNIARMIDSGQFGDGTRFLVSEFVDALSVDEILSIHGRLDPGRTARIIRQVANALNEVHQEGVIHRDLRPENIIVVPGENEAEQAILVNFEASNGEPNQNNLPYKAPEVFSDRISTISSDVYSLAVIAYEMLTGVLPFEGKTAREMTRSQYDGLSLLPTQIRPELPPEVDDVLDKALSFDAADRFIKARDFGEAFYAALSEAPSAEIAKVTSGGTTHLPADEPAWKNRSPEPPKVENSASKIAAGAGILLMLALLAFGWYYIVKHPIQPEIVPQPVQNAVVENGQQSVPNVATQTEMPPLPRNVPQPPNTNFYQNTKQNLKGDLVRNFVGFTLYYPKDWKVNGPQESAAANSRGKFLDISRLTPEGRLKEQMLVSYYPSKGTFTEDADRFAPLVKETNDTLKKLLPGYQMITEGETRVNGDWRAYEVKFQGSGTSETGEKLVVWGRRLYIPAARPGVRNGFEITMLATSLADEVKSVDDVGVKGELAGILFSFEPSQNF